MTFQQFNLRENTKNKVGEINVRCDPSDGSWNTFLGGPIPKRVTNGIVGDRMGPRSATPV